MGKVVPWLKEDQYWSLPEHERALQWAAFLSDRVKVREQGGNNRGEWVAQFLKSSGLGEGYPWCAAFVTFCVRQAERADGAFRVSGSAAVRSWSKWAQDNGLLVTKPGRGDLFYWLNSNGTGHIGFVVRKVGPLVYTIEGNTSSGEQGSQRDGDGVYRRFRRGSKLRFIRLTP